MKKLMILLIAIPFLIAACGDTTGNVIKESCDEPYIFVGGECCLDQNDNDICDKDEVVKVLPSIKEECVINDNALSCISAEANSDGTVKITLRHNKFGIASPTKISLPNVNSCSESFSGEVEDGFDYKDSKEFVLNCDIDKGYIDSPIYVNYKTYEPTNSNGPQFAPYTIWNTELEGRLVTVVS